jgi:Flp pilus assembly protein TadD
MRGSPVFRYSFGDALAYETWARAIVAGDWLGKDIFYQAPLYPYFLALVHALFGPSLTPVRIVQLVLGTASCIFLVIAGTRFFDRKTGLLAGFLLALYPSAIFFDGLVGKSVLDLFFVTLLLAIMGGLHQEDRPKRWFAAGLVLGGLLLTRENSLVLLCALLLWLVIRKRANARAAAVSAALLLSGWALVVLPVGVRNYAMGGEFHLTTSQFGPNLYIGNNPAADGLYRPLRPGGGDASRERRDNTELAELALGRSLTPGEVSRYWTGRALDFVKESPVRWLALMGRKWLIFWNREEVADTDDQASYGRWSVVLRVLDTLFHFGVLFPLAAAGVFLTRHQWRKLWILYLAVVLYAGSVVLFIVLSRFRFPIVPVLVLFAAAGCVIAYQEGSRHGLRRLLAPAAAAVIAAVIANLPVVPERNREAGAVLQNNIGGAVWNTERIAGAAIPYFLESIRIGPTYAEPYKNLGTVLRVTGRWKEAMTWYDKARALRADDARNYEGLGICAYNLGRVSEAQGWFREALKLNPGLADAHYGLASSLEKLGRREEAQPHFSEAARLDPAYVGR